LIARGFPVQTGYFGKYATGVDSRDAPFFAWLMWNVILPDNKKINQQYLRDNLIIGSYFSLFLFF